MVVCFFYTFREHDQVSFYPDFAVDETAQSADIIAEKYVRSTSTDATEIASGSYILSLSVSEFLDL